MAGLGFDPEFRPLESELGYVDSGTSLDQGVAWNCLVRSCAVLRPLPAPTTSVTLFMKILACHFSKEYIINFVV